MSHINKAVFSGTINADRVKGTLNFLRETFEFVMVGFSF
jgi:hypothetical protein